MSNYVTRPTSQLPISFPFLFGLLMLLGGYLTGLPSILIYSFLFLILFTIRRPENIISPISIIHVYYFIWFIVGPSFAEIYLKADFSSLNYYAAYGMLFVTHSVAVSGASWGENSLERISHRGRDVPALSPTFSFLQPSENKMIAVLFVLYLISTSLVVAIVNVTGGLDRWINNPGDAFLNREGSGVYVVLSHFFIFCLSAMAGFYTYHVRRALPFLIFLSWLAVTSPVHGSKGLISTFLLVALTPWVRNFKLMKVKSVALGLTLVFIFFFGLYLRNSSWITSAEFLPYALNYFTTLRNLVLLIENFDPDFLTTFFLPFNKFLTPFGLSSLSLYYDMNHMLTDMFFPTAWEIRATEQWPVEADLYLNFYFFLGLPLIFIYTAILGKIYGAAQQSNNVGTWVVAMLLITSIVSHFRGSLINHIDFYFYPMLLTIYFLFRRLSYAR